MDESLKKKLNQLLKNNKSWPIIIEGGVKKEDFLNACIVPSSIPSSQLGVINDLKGPVLPDWVKAVEDRKLEKANLLVIDGLDKIPFEEQAKFKQILDSKRSINQNTNKK